MTKPMNANALPYIGKLERGPIILAGYDVKTGCLQYTDIRVWVTIDQHDTIINHASEEFKTDGHIHCANLSEGIKELIEMYLERLIWMNEGKTT